MSRTPKADVTKLPKWAFQLIAGLEQMVDDLTEENERLNNYLHNAEDAIEEMSKNDQCSGDCGQPEPSGITTYHGGVQFSPFYTSGGEHPPGL